MQTVTNRFNEYFGASGVKVAEEGWPQPFVDFSVSLGVHAGAACTMRCGLAHRCRLDVPRPRAVPRGCLIVGRKQIDDASLAPPRQPSLRFLSLSLGEVNLGHPFAVSREAFETTAAISADLFFLTHAFHRANLPSPKGRRGRAEKNAPVRG